MFPFQTCELSGMQDAQEDAMQDLGYILRYTAGTEDDYNMPSPPTYPAESSKTACGFRPLRPEERFAEEADVEAYLRLPIATSISNLDRFRLTDRYGSTLSSAQDYEFVGPVLRGPSGLVCRLKRVKNASR